jgi:2-polyprenyl-6-methoxyphenol hydroxylase-like FAD-dependent oxidoreductase
MTQPVLIAGAGPVGMTLASELARYGVAVRIIDKAPQRTDKSKALVIWSRTLELLDRGAGAAPFIAAGCKAEGANILSGDRVIGHVGFGDVQSPYPFGLMLPQSETERLLEEQLQSQGVTVERQVELVAYTSRDEAVDAVLRHADGRQESASAPWLIGCDGAHSVVRHTLGATFAGETLDSDWMLADVHIRNYPHASTDIAVYWHRDGTLVIFPISPGRYRVVADLPPSRAAHPPVPTLAEVQAVMDQRGPSGLVACDPVWLSGFRINDRKVKNYRAGRVFLAGDAAHIHSPAGGQGMNTGMQDAFNLAWKLALVVHGSCGAHLLDSYSAERSKVGDEVVKQAGRLTAIGTLRNPLAQGMRNVAGHLLLGLAPVRHTAADTMTEVSIGYPDSPLNGPALAGDVRPRPGERVAPAAGQVPPGAGDRPRFALFADRAAVGDLAGRFAGLVDPAIRPPLQDGAIWLVRPDGYVAMSARDVDTVTRYLAGLA